MIVGIGKERLRNDESLMTEGRFRKKGKIVCEKRRKGIFS